MKCIECDKPATWIRYTQFSGNHPYCTEHAEQESDFGEDDASYYSWGEYECVDMIPEEECSHESAKEGWKCSMCGKDM